MDCYKHYRSDFDIITLEPEISNSRARTLFRLYNIDLTSFRLTSGARSRDHYFRVNHPTVTAARRRARTSFALCVLFFFSLYYTRGLEPRLEVNCHFYD